MTSKLDDFTDICIKEHETIIRVVVENLQTVKEKREIFFKELHNKIEELDTKQKDVKTWPPIVHMNTQQQLFTWTEADEKKKTTTTKENSTTRSWNKRRMQPSQNINQKNSATPILKM